MNILKKLGLIFIALICVLFIISPVDFAPGLIIDDIFYFIMAIATATASVGKPIAA